MFQILSEQESQSQKQERSLKNVTICSPLVCVVISSVKTWLILKLDRW